VTPSPRPWRLWYDDQCEVCQAGVAWLRALDRGRGRVEAIALSSVFDEGPASGPPGVAIDDLLRNLHAVAPDGRLFVGAEAVAALARLFPLTWLAGATASLPGFAWLARRSYAWVAANRYSLSRCRGGVCRSVRQDLLRHKAPGRAFQVCRFVGWLLIAPLGLWLFVLRLGRQLAVFWRTRGRTATLLEGRLAIHYLGGGISGTVSILFGELFTMIRYGSLVVDPGGTRMRRSAARHLGRMGRPITCVVPTHCHEEHVGNIALAARATGARVRAYPRAMPFLAAPGPVGIMRGLVIGQPRPLTLPVAPLPERWLLEGSDLAVEVIETPGHCAEHVSFYAPADRLLIAGDAFMGTHFSSPNDDVDHDAWILALERLLALDIEVMVEAHGHVHTARADVLRELEALGLDCVASRRHPRDVLRAKLDFVRWASEQIALGAREGLPLKGIQATVFPWTQRWSYETAVQDAVAALVSGGAFGRHKVVRSFRPPPPGEGRLPAVYELRW
jgi:glyoxylase-like metal-dependent hydrolase (beta-lactamase superfamily II)/predicted DCC family thiol-disulfide oxidoreductase YuxK